MSSQITPRVPRAQRGRVPGPSAVSRARSRRAGTPLRIESPRRATPLESALRWLRRHGLLLLAVALSLMHLAGLFAGRGPVPGWAPLSLVGVVGAAAAVWRLRRTARGQRVPLRLEFAFGLLVVDAVYALLQATGDLSSPLYPVAYLLAAWFAVAPFPRRIALGLVAAVVLQNALRYASLDLVLTQWQPLVVQTGFMALFALLYHVILAARLWASRRSESEAVTRRLQEAEESARSLRLVVADRSRDRRAAGDDELLSRRLLLGAVLEVERAVSSILEGAHVALDGHSLALYWLTENQASLELRDGRCAAGLLARGPLGAGDGVLGSALRHGLAVRHVGKVPGVNWYERQVAVRSVCAVPVVERTVDGTGFVRGVLVADRLEPEPFDDRDVQFLNEVASQVARAVEAERLVGELHRAKDSHDRLQRAAESLNRAATVEEVARTASRLARELVPDLDLAAVTRVEGEGAQRVHSVCAAEGPRRSEFDGLEYDDNDGVVAHATRLGAPLPARPPGVLERVKLFDLKVTGFLSLRVFPLVAAGQTLGTLVAGSKRRGLLDDEIRNRLESLAALTSGALARALALAQVSRLATTDVLTGLSNRRHLEELSARAFQEALRYGRPLSVLMTDVDHFKKVNDTHGHQVGDEVLRSVAGILQSQARGTDVVGRYGGEEFVLVLPDTDARGAQELAERIRKQVEAKAVASSAGPVPVTLSLGVATLRVHGNTLDLLVEAADQALYAAKRAGRNRVVLAAASEQAADVVV